MPIVNCSRISKSFRVTYFFVEIRKLIFSKRQICLLAFNDSFPTVRLLCLKNDVKSFYILASNVKRAYCGMSCFSAERQRTADVSSASHLSQSAAVNQSNSRRNYLNLNHLSSSAAAAGGHTLSTPVSHHAHGLRTSSEFDAVLERVSVSYFCTWINKV